MLVFDPKTDKEKAAHSIMEALKLQKIPFKLEADFDPSGICAHATVKFCVTNLPK